MKPWAERVAREVIAKMPTLAVGDEWAEVPMNGDRIRIERLERDDVWPFPMVHYTKLEGAEDRDPRMGAPMFLFGKLVRRGGGERWPR